LQILVVDDELSMREYLEVLLSRGGYQVVTAADVATAVDIILKNNLDVVISDIKLGQESGLEVLRAARASATPPEVILITAYGTPATAVEAMREGAYDYICKPFDNEELLLLVQKASEKRELLRENRELRASGAPGTQILVGKSLAMQGVWGLINKVASSRSTVLITGESGTGKELVARAIHWKSSRSGQPFLPVNCAALAEGVLESELFGHVKGAFTGATADRAGIMVSAGAGSVFLDEIGEISPAMQVKLLRVLQERRVKPVGSSEEIPFEARVLAATNRNLEAEVKSGRFREDLYYRLNVIAIELPPLRKRREDIGVLANFFLDRMKETLGRPELSLSPATLELLEAYSFPGNVRQLENIIERAATLVEGSLLVPAALPPSLRGESEPIRPNGAVVLVPGFSLDRYLDETERHYLLAALERADGNKTKAAEILNLSFRSFRYRLAKHGLADKLDSADGPLE
jgi:two-component system response regulator PilR (NtrC family)